MAKAEPYNPKYQQVQWTDSQGREWMLEDDGKLDAQKEQKERIPAQIVAKNPKMITNAYDKLSKAVTAEEVIKVILRSVSWGSDPTFRPVTFRELLEEKLPLAETDSDKKCITLAISALKKNGAVPKKLKVAYNMATGGSNTEE